MIENGITCMFCIGYGNFEACIEGSQNFCALIDGPYGNTPLGIFPPIVKNKVCISCCPNQKMKNKLEAVIIVHTLYYYSTAGATIKKEFLTKNWIRCLSQKMYICTTWKGYIGVSVILLEEKKTPQKTISWEKTVKKKEILFNR